MNNQHILHLPSHIAGPTCQQLIRAGLITSQIGQKALSTHALRAAISPCGRKASLLPTRPMSVPDTTARQIAAAAARANLRPLLQTRARWSVLRKLVHQKTAPLLTPDEIDSILREQIALHLRRIRLRPI